MKSLSEEEVGNISMEKLEIVWNIVLRETTKEVRKKRRAGYQENILKDLLEDMDRMIPTKNKLDSLGRV